MNVDRGVQSDTLRKAVCVGERGPLNDGQKRASGKSRGYVGGEKLDRGLVNSGKRRNGGLVRVLTGKKEEVRGVWTDSYHG